MQRLAGNCELRSVVMCSHGVKEKSEARPMTADGPGASPISTMRIASVAEGLDKKG